MKTLIRRYLPPLLALAILLAASVVHGLWTDRWGTPPDLHAAADRLRQVPATIGDWQAEELPMDPRQVERAEAVGHLQRVYVKRGESSASEPVAAVQVTVLCGRTGPMAVHPPTVCFTGGGMDQLAPETRTKVLHKSASEPDELFRAEFKSESPTRSIVQATYWSWSGDGRWRAPGNPRWTFARFPYLYKLYVSRELPQEVPSDGPQAAGDDDLAVEFLELFLPELNKALFLRSEREE